jgi:hypothetical protein
LTSFNIERIIQLTASTIVKREVEETCPKSSTTESSTISKPKVSTVFVSVEDSVPQDVIEYVDYKMDLFHCAQKYDSEMNVKYSDELFQAGSKRLHKVTIKKKQEDFTCYDLFAKVYYPLHYISNNTWINTKIYLTGSPGCQSIIPKVDILSCSRIKRLFLYLLIIFKMIFYLNIYLDFV